MMLLISVSATDLYVCTVSPLNKENMRSAKRFLLYCYIRQHIPRLYDFTCSYCIYVGSRHLFPITLHAQ